MQLQAVGPGVGDGVGAIVGEVVGDAVVGAGVGATVGGALGRAVVGAGVGEGVDEGCGDGGAVGTDVGTAVGTPLGCSVMYVGSDVGGGDGLALSDGSMGLGRHLRGLFFRLAVHRFLSVLRVAPRTHASVRGCPQPAAPRSAQRAVYGHVDGNCEAHGRLGIAIFN